MCPAVYSSFFLSLLFFFGLPSLSQSIPSVAALDALGALRDALQPRVQCWQALVAPRIARWESALDDRATLQQMQSDGGATGLDFRGRKKFEQLEKSLRRLPRIQRALEDGVLEFDAKVRVCFVLVSRRSFRGCVRVTVRARARAPPRPASRARWL
jgi:hypothetical protein